MTPKVTIVTAVYNGEKYLEESINSMLNQTYEDFEFIIVDDGSTDNSQRILKQITDSRIRVFQQKNQGQTNALITGINHAKGELIARLDQDDYSFPDRLKRQVEFMDTNPRVVLCGSRFHELYQDKFFPQRVHFIQTHTDIRKYISCFNPFAHSTVVFRRESYLKVFGYDKRFLIGMDYDLWIRLMEIGEVHNIKEVLTVVRVHGNSFSNKNSKFKTLEDIKIRYYAYSKFGGNPLLTGFFLLKSVLGLLLPRWLKTLFSKSTRK